MNALPYKFGNDDEWVNLTEQDITSIFISLQKLKIIKKLPIEPPRWDQYNGKCNYEEYEEIYNESLEQSNWEFKLA